MRRDLANDHRTRALLPLVVAAAVAIMLLALAPAAAAQAPTDAQYDDDVEIALDRAEADPAEPGDPGREEAEQKSGMLALTGADVLVLIAIAASLAAAGIGLRRLTAPR